MRFMTEQGVQVRKLVKVEWVDRRTREAARAL